MDWRDQFHVEDEKVAGRWLALAVTVVLLAVAGYYYFHSGSSVHGLSGLKYSGFLAIRNGA